MKRTTYLATFFIALAAASATAFGISAAVDAPRTLMSRGDYQDARRGIEAATRAALADCRAIAGAAREICRAKARGEERVKKAELQARYEGTVAAAAEIRVARVRARYDLDRARCVVLSPDQRLPCLRSAREARTRDASEPKVASTT